MPETYSYFASSPKGLEGVLAKELKEIGAQGTKQTTAGVLFSGDLKMGYRACLWLRTANRVFLKLSLFRLHDADDLYNGIREIDWAKHLDPEGTFAVDFSSAKSVIKHSHFGALKAKDAIVDQFRERFDVRPSIDVNLPDIRVNIFANKDQAIVNLDLSGQSLHKRGYRTDGGPAPLKENLAAAILLQSGWREIAKNGGTLIDPMCGSGTFPIEGAMIAADMAPGLMRDYFGFIKWKQHNTDLWQTLLDEAEERESISIGETLPIFGYDQNEEAVANSKANADRAGLGDLVSFRRQSFNQLTNNKVFSAQEGLVVINPPYGERLGEPEQLKKLYRQIGKTMSQTRPGWKGAVFSGHKEVTRTIGTRPVRIEKLYNGSIPCELLRFDLGTALKKKREQAKLPIQPQKLGQKDQPVSTSITMFQNRLNKNLKRLKSWIKKEGVTCYRVYDKDIPEYAVAIDVYEKWAHVQEYKAPSSIPPETAEERLHDILTVLPDLLSIPGGNIFLKQRSKQKSTNQYEKIGSKKHTYWIKENRFEFEINLDSYIDTGLFLDHRITRHLIEELSTSARFLNLFSYTGTASVYAARGGAIATTSVDKSNTYTRWAQRNMKRNGFDSARHSFIAADCLDWIQNETNRYDLIFLDPPTFSNTKKTGQRFDIQSDHVELLRSTTGLLSKDGILVFSNNYQNFRMDEGLSNDLSIEEISLNTIPPDFERNTKIHKVWLIRK